MRKSVWEILVPAFDGKKEIPVERHRKWDTEVHKIAGGLTILKQTKGYWTSKTGKSFSDRMIPVRIICTKRQINKIMDITAYYYPNEEEILAYKISDTFLLKKK